MNFPNKVKINEVGPRDGLQNEAELVPAAAKIDWINMLSETGASYIEVSSFVHPDWIPQLKDATEVAKKIKRNPDVTYAALVPNNKGLDRALEVNVDEICLFLSASETHNKNNINKTIDQTLPIIENVSSKAKESNKQVRGYVSTVFGCPYEGDIDVEKVISICDRLFTMGVDEISIGDTIGVADPVQVDKVLTKLLKYFPKDKLAMHFHDTRGTALANVLVSLNHGITNFDSAVGGLGGCPYAKGASGNLATDDLLYMLHRMGIETGMNIDKVIESALYIENYVSSLSSHQMKIINSER
ncbi:hydroxymethylglutaryl-CoA lyase [Virgibacillus subterraneus]|uniref:Hydroxymethylglutaryl-CoA lyase n=2 Tax=Virgibacillus TaxID=84406 RepID=A0A1H1C0G2_9BACI|nr:MULTISPECIES: hydroxymethylglutaryl-CoA lyase [Virgibacillus]SDQ57707.1 hydroxymethylglutaryl-CoA lyase [Virgibacillus salinus]SEQ54616.1 hydroxymethylglutaryl-CoA lyase [Virgibacillus subterraneus]